MDLSVLTPTQRRIVEVLLDGEGHTRRDLEKCIDDELAGPGNLKVHLSRIRKKLRPQGYDVVPMMWNSFGVMWKLYRVYASPNDGRK